MKTTFDELLNSMRSSAIRQDWNSVLYAVQKVLDYIGFKNALHVGVLIVEEQLGYFESNYTNKSWPRESIERLLHVINGTSSIEQPLEIPAIDLDSLDPGFNSFITAIENLWYAARIHKTAYVEFISDAIAGIVMWQMIEQWGKSHSKLWEEWKTSNDEGRFNIQVAFWRDLSVQQLIQDKWLEIAGQFEQQMK